METAEKILIVDDSITNRSFLRAVLEDENFVIWEAVNGLDAINLLQEKIPDIILLDLMMPVMNGFDVCRQIKKDKRLAEVPIIIISAITETEDKVEGLRLGAVDYVTKPFQHEELMVRIRTHLSLREKEKRLEKVNEQLLEYQNNLENLVKKRTTELEVSNNELLATNIELKEQKSKLEKTLEKLNETQVQLIHSEKMASLGVLVAGVAHEINNPVNYVNASVVGLKNNLEIIESYSKLYSQVTENKEEVIKKIIAKEKEMPLGNITEMLKRSAELIEVGVKRTTEIVKSLKSFTRSNQNEIEAFDIQSNIESTLIILHSYHKDRIEIIKQFEKLPMIECYPGQINQVLLNILINAMQAIKDKGKIWISLGLKNSRRIFIKIRDTGAGIEKEDMNHIFDAFYTTKGNENGSGLGLSISSNIINEHNGEILVNSELGEGSCFTIILPIKQSGSG